MELPVNHEEAEQLARLKREESNLARCYLDIKLQNSEMKDLLLSWMQTSNIAQDITFAPLYKTTEKYLAEKRNQEPQKR